MRTESNVDISDDMNSKIEMLIGEHEKNLIL